MKGVVMIIKKKGNRITVNGQTLTTVKMLDIPPNRQFTLLHTMKKLLRNLRTWSRLKCRKGGLWFYSNKIMR